MYISNFKDIGKNVKIFDSAKIINPENISIGDESVIADFTFLYGVGKGIKIGFFCHITEHCIIQAGGEVIMEHLSAIGPRTTILAASDDYEGNGLIGLTILNKYRNIVYKDVKIGKYAHIGMGSIIMPGVEIGEGCQIGAGSLVTKDMPAWTQCYGHPCKPVKQIPKENIISKAESFLHEYYNKKG